MLLYQVVFEDLYNNDRYLSTSLFTKMELQKNIKAIKKNTYLDKFPDSRLLDVQELINELKQVQDVGYIVHKIEEIF